MIHTVKDFSVVSEAEVEFFWNSLAFLDDLMDVGNLIFGSSAFSKISLNINQEVHGSCTIEAWLGEF